MAQYISYSSRNSGGGGTVTAVTASSPLASSGGTTPNISLTGSIPAANIPLAPNKVYVDFISGNDSNTGSLVSPWKTLQHAYNSITPSINEPYVIYLSGGNNSTDVNITAKPNVSIIADYQIQIPTSFTISGGVSNDGCSFQNIVFNSFNWVRNDVSEIGVSFTNCSFFSGPVFKQTGTGTATALALNSTFVNSEFQLPNGFGVFSDCDFLGTTSFDDPGTSGLAYIELDGGYSSGLMTVTGFYNALYITGFVHDVAFGAALAFVAGTGGAAAVEVDSAGFPPTYTGTPASITYLSKEQNISYANLTASQAVVTDSSKKLASLLYTNVNTGSSLVFRDSNGNAAFNNSVSTSTTIVTAAQTISMSGGSARVQKTTGTSTATFNLPDATTLYSGMTYEFNNNSTGIITINKNDGTTLVTTVVSGGFAFLICTDNSTVNGVWDFHFMLPSNSSWGTSGISLAGSLSLKGATSGSLTNSAAAVTSSYSLIWPAAQGAASTVLTNDGAGNLSWSPSGGSSFQFFISSQITTNTVTPVTSTTFVTFDNSPAFTFTPTVSGKYRVYSTIPIAMNAANFVGIYRIFNTSGGATVNAESQTAQNGSNSANFESLYTETIFTLTSGTSYVFDIQAKVNSGGGSTTMLGGLASFYMFAEQVA